MAAVGAEDAGVVVNAVAGVVVDVVDVVDEFPFEIKILARTSQQRILSNLAPCRYYV